ncbi:superfamily I DNA/RNA helicase [Streptomyces sp. HB132]|nr:superfamily I DNA/RNA helicase [Streptomyces sp. HB132]
MVVDEAQDLHPAQWRLLRAAAPARPDDLFIAGDPHQRIYDTKVSLKAVGVRVSGRSTRMRKNYRSTHEILRWSTALLVGRPFEQLADDARNETLLGYRSALHGSGPEVFGGSSESAELDALVTRVRAWLDSGIEPGDIGIGSRFNKSCGKAVERLTAAGIRAARLRGDAVSDPAAVQVGTMHAFKGLEFRCVCRRGGEQRRPAVSESRSLGRRRPASARGRPSG